MRDGERILVPKFMSLYIFDEVFVQRVYDSCASLNPETIIDIGANTGMFVTRAKQLWPNSYIVAYEPEPFNFQMLTETIKRNRFHGIYPVNAAVMGEEGEVLLFRHPKNIGGHSTVHAQGFDSVSVAGESMEQALRRLPTGRADLIKLDCEGAEGAIFHSLTSAHTDRIGALVYEPDGSAYSVASVNAALEGFGYHIALPNGLVTATKSAP
jgi:FkbM family methyltransferase